MPDSYTPVTPRLSWVAAVFALLAGVTMLYVPYEFGAPLFRTLYPYIRPLGALWMLSGALLTASILYPTSHPTIHWAGRALFALALGPYWYTVAVQAGNITGTIAYPLLISLVLVERHPKLHPRGMLGPFAMLVGLSFGLVFLLVPERLASGPLASFGASTRWLGLGFLLSTVWLATAWRRRHPVSEKLGSLAFGALFLALVLPTFRARSWIGLEFYASLSLACLLGAIPELPRPAGIRWRLLRGLILASVFPILTLGALTSKFAQDAIRAELWTEARQVTSAEVTWLEEFQHQFRYLLQVEAAEPELLTLVRRRATRALDERLAAINTRSTLIDRLLLLDSEGVPLARSPGQNNTVLPSYAHREYVQRVLETGEPFLTPPFRSSNGETLVVASLPILDDQNRVQAVLAGAFLLDRLSLARRARLSSSYVIQVFDRRTGALLRDSERDARIEPVRLTSDVQSEVLNTPSGLVERFDEKGAVLLIAHEAVPGTPWIVVSTARAQQAYAPLSRLSLLVIAVALATACIAVLLSHLVSLDLARRLGGLRTSFARWAGLDRASRPYAHGADEITDLETALRDMALEIERAQAELKAAVVIRDEFLSVASHELRTPLTPLKMTLDLIMRQLDQGEGFSSERQRLAVERMRRQVTRLGRLISALLDVSRIQAGRFALEREKMEMGTTLRAVVERMRQEQPQRAEQLELVLPAHPVEGEWDPDRLDQVLTNLIENAFRYSPKDSPVRLTLRDDGNKVEIVVSDEGMGIPSDALPKVFAPFFRAQNAASSHSGGLGLGLAICREIVERHGGRIWASSEGPGHGSAFHVVVPRHPESAYVS